MHFIIHMYIYIYNYFIYAHQVYQNIFNHVQYSEMYFLTTVQVKLEVFMQPRHDKFKDSVTTVYKSIIQIEQGMSRQPVPYHKHIVIKRTPLYIGYSYNSHLMSHVCLAHSCLKNIKKSGSILLSQGWGIYMRTKSSLTSAELHSAWIK